jgi:hypothetical protein
MKNYDELELPPLPEPWVWECGESDGDPHALLRRRGWCIRVHEADVGYTEDLAITVRPDRDGFSIKEVDAYIGGGTGAIPFRVFQAVYDALRQWYEVDQELEDS